MFTSSARSGRNRRGRLEQWGPTSDTLSATKGKVAAICPRSPCPCPTQRRPDVSMVPCWGRGGGDRGAAGTDLQCLNTQSPRKKQHKNRQTQFNLSQELIRQTPQRFYWGLRLAFRLRPLLSFFLSLSPPLELVILPSPLSALLPAWF